EAPPALDEPLHVLIRAKRADHLVLHAPLLLGQVAARARLGDEVEERFHDGSLAATSRGLVWKRGATRGPAASHSGRTAASATTAPAASPAAGRRRTAAAAGSRRGCAARRRLVPSAAPE